MRTEGAPLDTKPLPDGELAPGEHSTSLLGTGVTFTTENPAITAVSVDEALMLLPPKPPDVPTTRRVVMLRGATLQGADDGSPDVDAWAEERPEVEVKKRKETTVGGCDAVVYDVTADEEAPLMPSPAGPLLLYPNETGRVWAVEQASRTRWWSTPR